MDQAAGAVLPYRTDAADLARWVEARARGRTPEQIRALGFSAKGFEGTALGAAALGFVDAATGELTERGRGYSLATGPARAQGLLEAIAAYAPYAGLLEAVLRRGGEPVTDAGWIETWWATHGFGNSQSNRMEGAAVFGRLMEALGLARYIPGRRGHPTRIEWSGEGVERLRRLLAGEVGVGVVVEERGVGEQIAPESIRERAPAVEWSAPVAAGGRSDVSLDLGEWGTARVSVPTRLPAAEKRRLVALLEVLITEEG